MREELRTFLVGAGASEDDIARAEGEGWLALLTLDRRLLPGPARFDLAAVARESGLAEPLLRRLWRAVGFPDVPAKARLFSDQDVAAARRLVARAEEDGFDEEELLRNVRVISSAMARVAAVEADTLAEVLDELRAAGMSDDDIAVTVLDRLRWDDLSALIDYAHRLQLRAAMWRRLALETVPDLAITIAFADLAGYTRLSSELEPDKLSQLVRHWEEVAYDTVAVNGARVVKTIGDEVMFVGLPLDVARTALALRDAAASDTRLLPLRAGLAAGPVVARDGDYYGPAVNLASRLTEVASRGQILAAASVRSEIDDPSVRWVPAGRRRLRSIGDVEAFALERALERSG